MFIEARLLNGLKKSLTYAVPSHLQGKITLGSFVHVPLRNFKTLGYVVKLIPQLAETSYKIKEIIDIAPFPTDPHYEKFLAKLADYYATDEFFFINRLRTFLKQKKTKDKPAPPSQTDECKKIVSLTAEQKSACDFVARALTQQTHQATLLHGVTGSGKTEVYKKLIEQACCANKSVLFLVPEVTLAVQFYRILKQQLPATIALHPFHSASSADEKKRLWQASLAGNPCVIIGVHLPVMLPLKNLGLIIVDEEHEVGYQEKKHPKINSKEAALLRAYTYNIPILLGSATPSIASLHQAKKKKWHFFSLTKRFAGAFPEIKIIDLLQDKKRPIFWLSTELEKQLKVRLARHEQSIIFLNRRGYSFFVVCQACSHIFSCLSCSVSLTLHSNNLLRCHYCDYRLELPSSCPSCSSPEKQFLKKGIGTQQLAALLEKKFPTARIGRADLDTTVNKKNWQQTLAQFERGDLDILVGTQTITKGYHFPRVTLVGIVWADANLHFPKYNATETALQQLIQVAGRAGRQTPDSTVIVQTFAHHPAFRFLSEVDYLKFYGHELKNREDAHYPPFTRLFEIELKHKKEEILSKESHELAQKFREFVEQKKIDIIVLGPAVPPVNKIKNIYSQVIYLKCPSASLAKEMYQKCLEEYTPTSSVHFTPNALN